MEDNDENRLNEISEQLIRAVQAVLSAWVHHCVGPYRAAAAGPDSQIDAQIDAVAQTCSSEITEAVACLVRADIDDQATTPLAILRGAGRFPTELLQSWGVSPFERDPFDVRANPGDIYNLAPKTWSDLGPEVGEIGLMWGAAKAHIHLQRRRQSNPQPNVQPNPGSGQ